MNDELKPCPLCGSPAEVVELWPGSKPCEEGAAIDYDSCNYLVRCKDERNCYLSYGANVYASGFTQEGAIAAWNKSIIESEGSE